MFYFLFFFVCVCMHVYICVLTYVFIAWCACMCVYIYMLTYVFIVWCACMCIYMLTHVLTAWVCTHACGDWRLVQGVLFNCSPPYTLKQELSPEPRACWFRRSRKPDCSGDPVSGSRDYRRDCHICNIHQTFMWACGIWTLGFRLARQVFSPVSQLPCPLTDLRHQRLGEYFFTDRLLALLIPNLGFPPFPDLLGGRYHSPTAWRIWLISFGLDVQWFDLVAPWKERFRKFSYPGRVLTVHHARDGNHTRMCH